MRKIIFVFVFLAVLSVVYFLVIVPGSEQREGCGSSAQVSDEEDLSIVADGVEISVTAGVLPPSSHQGFCLPFRAVVISDGLKRELRYEVEDYFFGAFWRLSFRGC